MREWPEPWWRRLGGTLLLLLAVAVGLPRPVARTSAPADVCPGGICGVSIAVVHYSVEPTQAAGRSAPLAIAVGPLLPDDESALAAALHASDRLEAAKALKRVSEAVQHTEALIEDVSVERSEPLKEFSTLVRLVDGIPAPGATQVTHDQAPVDGLLLARLIGELGTVLDSSGPLPTVTTSPRSEFGSARLPTPSLTLTPAPPAATPTTAPTMTPRPSPTFTPAPEPEPVAPTEPDSAPALRAAPASASEPEPTATPEPSPTAQPSPTGRAAARTPRRSATPTATPRVERMSRARSTSPTAAPSSAVQIAEVAAATASTPTPESVESGRTARIVAEGQSQGSTPTVTVSPDDSNPTAAPTPTVPPAKPTAEPEPTPAQPAGLLWPARGPLTTRFGEVGWYAPRGHSGLDIAARHGAPVLAAAAGRVVLATHDGNGYGIHVVIEHGGGLRTLYAHLSQLVVAGGQAVERGEVIGRVGSTGLSTGPHLHFEVRQQGVLRDPLAYLR